MADSQKYTAKLQGKRILIIGGSSGIGYAVAEAALESGAHVTISSSSESRISTAVSSLQDTYPSARAQNRIMGFACDLSSPALDANVEKLLAETIKTGGGQKLDHIVYTAGDTLANLPLAEITLEKLQQAAMVRFNGPLLVAKHAAAHMNPGPASSITLTTGMVSQKPMKDWSMIAGYAAGLHGLTRNLALDMAPLRVNLVSPGPVKTPLWAGIPEDKRNEMYEGMKKRVATGEVGKPEDVAEAYLYAMKDVNATGSVIDSNGGSMLM